ncbi:hypothetical protein SCLCIDRAFT_23227 [Scleroderma citrinum Foug A]|uniref:Hydrophobin n=1 Tax=Scleroderma citrinum Foug A TaxID=1036808 RepID=A0A0C3E8V7_9AGAM|nr:hypothetical protein SCLCIDRAFT_23227 [Scleroderma citrinum Foug A]
MFSRVFAILPLALLVAAKAHSKARGGQCSNGTVQCCQSLQNAYNERELLTQHGVVVADAAAQGLVGVTCSPITAVGVGRGCSASQQTACCTGTDYNGLFNLGCSSLNAVI